VGGLHLFEGGVSILQYANDMILFMEHDLQKDVYMGLILRIFDQLFGLKIDFYNNNFFSMGIDLCYLIPF
jgi:hypothetical protein